MIALSVISVIVLLGVLIFVHELGHFLVAKKAGVGVLKFSLGFGPKLLGKKIGETEYLLSLIPLGGYVKLLGETEEDNLSEEDTQRAFLKQTVWKRMAIVIAGPLFNFILAIVIFCAVNMYGTPVLTTKIGGIQENSPAFSTGLRAGDVITAVNGREVTHWMKMADIIGKSAGKELKLTIRRGEGTRELMVKPSLVKARSFFGEEIDSYKIGISPANETVIYRQNPLRAFWSSFEQTWTITELTLVSIYKMFQGVVSPKTLGGPIMIAQIAGAQARAGFMHFLLFMALLSINLAVLNLLPVPILDGGHLLFYVIEGITGREIGLKWREMAQQVGFVILVLLMIFVFVMDIERLNLKIFGDIARIFSRLL